jgi:hypothetical protein
VTRCLAALVQTSAAIAAITLGGCRDPGFVAVTASLPSPRGREPARIVTTVGEQPVPVELDPVYVDYLEWTPAAPHDAPPPLTNLPEAVQLRTAWVLRTRLRGSSALTPTVYLAEREGGGLLYSTRHGWGHVDPGATFDLREDGSIVVMSPTAPPPAVK